MDDPRVIIVILSWNQRDDLLACLDSLAQIDYNNYQIVVIDNGSTDGSQSAVEARFPNVVVLAQSTNLGCAGGRNVGVRYALSQGADYILLLDNDTKVAQDFLTRLVEVGESDTSIGILGSKIYYYDDPRRVWTAGAFINFRTGATFLPHSGELDQDFREDIYDVDFVAGCALMAKRVVFETIGLFDEDYFIYYEETDWCARALKAGYRVVVVPGSALWHKESQSLGGASSPAKIYYMTRNQFLFIRKILPRHCAIIATLCALAGHLRTILAQSVKPKYRQMRQQRDARVHALVDVLRGRFGKWRTV